MRAIKGFVSEILYWSHHPGVSEETDGGRRIDPALLGDRCVCDAGKGPAYPVTSKSQQVGTPACSDTG